MSGGAALYPNLLQHVELIQQQLIPSDRKERLQGLLDYIQDCSCKQELVNLVFICTHNSRRSHLAQVWAQVAAAYYQLPSLFCYSGGTAETALHPQVIALFRQQGFSLCKLAAGSNPIYSIKYADHSPPILGFSKLYNHPFNPANRFAAIMTCSEADADCPLIAAADKRIALTYADPKVADGRVDQAEVYAARALQIASEMFYIFSRITL